MTVLARLRRLWLDVHLWLGVGLLVAIIPLSVTGSALVWRDALERQIYAERYAVTGPDAVRPITDYATAARAAFGSEATLMQVRLPREPGDPVVATGRIPGPVPKGARPRNLTAWIDPPTGKVLAVDETAKDATQVMHVLHGSLMIPEIGRKVVGWLGWAMFVSCATGLWLWWPRHAGLVKGLRWRRGTSQLFNLHHTVGFWICLPLAALSLTGVYISFPQTSRAVFGLPAQPPRPPAAARNAPPLAEPNLSLADAVAAAQSAAPGKITQVQVPTRGKEPTWRIEAGGKTIRILDATGEAKTGRSGGSGEGQRDELSTLMRHIHDGHEMGIVWQVTIFLGGIAPAVLSITGLIMWLRRRGRRRALLAPVAAE